MQDQSNRHVEELEHLNQLKDDFLSTVSHELRSPITNIKMATQMLKLLLQSDQTGEVGQTQGGVDSEQAELQAKIARYLVILEQECDRETNLLNNFLDLQQLEAGNYYFSPKIIDLQEFIPQVIQPFLNRAVKRQQTLGFKIAENLSILIADPIVLERILAELLCNACKFTPAGEEIIVELSSSLPSAEALNTLLLRVTNSGVEIPLDQYTRIFDRFYRIPSGDRWKHDGTGLGLALVKKLTEHVGGSIQVESQAGQTCFTVKLPMNC